VPKATSLSLTSALPNGQILAELASWEGGYRVDVVHVDPLSGAVDLLVRDGASPKLSSTGHVLFNRRDQLLAVPFDVSGGKIVGPAVTVLGPVRSNAYSVRAQFDLSSHGTLAHLGGSEFGRKRKIAFIGRGDMEVWVSDQVTSDNTAMDVSADGSWTALTVMNRELLFEVWGSEVDRSAIRRIASLPGMDCLDPVLSARAEWVAFRAQGETSARGIYLAPVDGSTPPRLAFEQAPEVEGISAESFSPDGSELLVRTTRGDERRLLAVPLGGELPAEGRVLLASGYGAGGELSPDGAFLSYKSNDAGRWEVFVRARRADGSLGAAVPVGVGQFANWDRPDSGPNRLLYFTLDHRVMAVRVSAGPRVGAPTEVADWKAVMPDIVSAAYAFDDRYLVVLRGEDEIPPDQIELVLGFDAEIERLASGER
jgi:hypothetical protein